MWELLDRLFGQGFMPHGHCYLWTPSMVWTQVSANLLIGLAYTSITTALTLLVRRIRAIPFASMYLGFGVFILSCGLTHFSDVVTVWHPIYWVDAAIRVVTAVASVATAVLIWPLLPRATAMAESARLSQEHGRLLAEAHQQLEEAHAKLAESEREAVSRAESTEIQFRDLIDNLPELAWTARPDGHVDFFNRRWFEYTGTKSYEMQGWGWRDVHDPDVLPRVVERWARSIETGESFEMEFPLRGASGRYRWFLTRIRPLRDSTGRIVRWFGTNTDVDDFRRLRVEASRAADEARAALTTMRLAFAAAGAGSFDWDVGGGKVLWSEELTRLYGMQGQPFDGSLEVWSSMVIEADRGIADASARAALEHDTYASRDFRIRRRDNDELRWLQTHSTCTRDGEGRPVRVIGVNVDVTERKAAEEALRASAETLEQRVAQRTAELENLNRELEAFSYSVSHDLRSPLRGIAGFAKALEEHARAALDDESKQYLARIEASASRMGQLIDDLLALARLGRAAVVVKDIDVTALVGTIRGTLEESSERRARWDVQGGVRTEADAGLLRILLENLLANAWKFSRERADALIAFGVEETERGRAYFVRDNGAGFDMAHAKRLFGAFQRLHPSTRFEGSGIGLATVQRIVHRHGGRIWAESKPGEGATFFFTLGTDGAKGPA